jgi:hypothetical protein
MAGKDTNTGAARARETRSALGIDAAEPLGCILTVVERDLGLPVIVAALPQGIAGCCWREGERTVLWVNGTQAAVRQRFTLAHEVGHVRCGHDADVPVETFATIGGKSTDSRESRPTPSRRSCSPRPPGSARLWKGSPRSRTSCSSRHASASRRSRPCTA